MKKKNAKLSRPNQREQQKAQTRAVILDVAREQLEREIAQRITKVDEFRILRQICEELKIRCWLFGGTAAGYGHYVHWDLLREGGDARFQPNRFDYD